MTVRVVMLALAITTGAAACRSALAPPPPMDVSPLLPGETAFVVAGNVRYIPLEGGFFAIVGTDGKTYDPINLPAEYRRDGLPVKATVKVRSDMVSVHMVGTIVEIVRIESK